ncbi:MAG: hypothetical protein JF606_05780 [Burkholderiales bacterium]|nr:hypothetical protein [Burkholderiales bacterium]
MDPDLEAALKASLADIERANEWKNHPNYSHLNIGDAPRDGNCFFHSILQLARAQIAESMRVEAQALEPKHIRQHIASKTIDQLIQCKKGGSEAEALMERYPHLELIRDIEPEDQRLLDLRDPRQLVHFISAVGEDAAVRCKHMTPVTVTNLYHLARDTSWDNAPGDYFAAATAAAFPGLRITVETDLGPKTFGEGQKKPNIVVLHDRHYAPATERP